MGVLGGVKVNDAFGVKIFSFLMVVHLPHFENCQMEASQLMAIYLEVVGPSAMVMAQFET